MYHLPPNYHSSTRILPSSTELMETSASPRPGTGTDRQERSETDGTKTKGNKRHKCFFSTSPYPALLLCDFSGMTSAYSKTILRGRSLS